MATQTFQQAFDAVDFGQWRERSLDAGDEEISAALSPGSSSLQRMAALLSPRAAEKYLEEMAHLSQAITRRRFGYVLQMYAPVYISNECTNGCVYCGFNHTHQIHRITLDIDQVLQEAEVLARQGFQHILLVSGEHPKRVSVEYLEEIVQRLRPDFASIAIEVAPQSEEGYRRLVHAGVDSLTIYQETYDREVYREVHRSGPKRDFDHRLQTAERAARAGMKRIGIGALLGLADWRHDILATYLHAEWMQRHHWRCQFSISVPRLQSALESITELRPVDDRSLTQIVCALRICLPDTGLVLSTRERAELRDGLVRLGITQLSAGSQTEPGGYHQPDEHAEQFVVADHRSPVEVCQALKAMGYEVVWKDWEGVLHGRA